MAYACPNLCAKRGTCLASSCRACDMCDTTRRAASVAPTAAGGGESIRARVARLNQLLSGQAYDLTHQVLVGQEGLLDTLVVLYDECCCPSLAKNQYIAAFVNKCMSSCCPLSASSGPAISGCCN